MEEQDATGPYRRFSRRAGSLPVEEANTLLDASWILPETTLDLELTPLRSRDSETLLDSQASGHNLDAGGHDDVSEHRSSLNVTDNSVVDSTGKSTGTDQQKAKKAAKVATQKRRQVLFHALRFHLAPLAMTIFFTVLYTREIRWPFSQAPTAGTAQAGIQFLAQLHETLVIVSLAQILLHRIRYHLLRETGIELGLLYANFRLGSPLYCFSSEFLGAARRMFHNSTTLGTATLTLFTIIISVALSPLSAILLTPQPRVSKLPAWDPLWKDIFFNGSSQNMSDHYEIRVPIVEKDLWPPSIGPELNITWSCDNISNNDSSCSRSPSWFNMEYENILLSTLNKFATLGDQLNNWDPVLTYGRTIHVDIEGLHMFYSIDFLGIWVVTCPLLTAAVFGETLTSQFTEKVANISFDGLFASISLAGGILERQPLVFSIPCELPSMPPAAGNQSLTEVLMSIDLTNYCLDMYGYPYFNRNLSMETASILAKQDWENGFVTFFDLEEYMTPNSTISTTAISGYTWYDVLYNQIQYGIEIIAFECHWAEAGPAYGDMILNGTNILNSFVARPGNLAQSSEIYNTTVKIDAEWMNSLLTLVPFDFGNTSVAEILVQTSNNLWSPQIILPILVASTMAAVSYSFVICEDDNLFCEQISGNPSSMMEYDYNRNLTAEAALPGHQITYRATLHASITAYRFSNSWLIILGFVFLYLHVALVLIHLAIIVLGGFWTSNAWSNLGDFVALALRSPPVQGQSATTAALLAEMDAGVSSTKAWGLVVRIRENNTGGQDPSEKDDLRLEMVLEEPCSQSRGEDRDSETGQDD